MLTAPGSRTPMSEAQWRACSPHARHSRLRKAIGIAASILEWPTLWWFLAGDFDRRRRSAPWRLLRCKGGADRTNDAPPRKQGKKVSSARRQANLLSWQKAAPILDGPFRKTRGRSSRRTPTKLQVRGKRGLTADGKQGDRPDHGPIRYPARPNTTISLKTGRECSGMVRGWCSSGRSGRPRNRTTNSPLPP